MKRAVSISIGSAQRDKVVEVDLLGQRVCLERTGTDGDLEKAARMYADLDGRVDAFGVGGADLGLRVDQRWYPLYSVQPMLRNVHRTPLVDGTGLKVLLEQRVADRLEPIMKALGLAKRVLVVAGVDRWGLSQGFLRAGYECVFGDFMFALNLPIPIHSETALKRLAAVLVPVVSRLPFRWVYPVGKDQEKHTPRWQQYFDQAAVIAGDCHYIRRYMPETLAGKIIVTNTTTQRDVEAFRQSGAAALVTTTPVLDGRSFGTNMMEAGIVAALGRREPVDYAHPQAYFQELDAALNRLNLTPQIQEF